MRSIQKTPLRSDRPHGRGPPSANILKSNLQGGESLLAPRHRPGDGDPLCPSIPSLHPLVLLRLLAGDTAGVSTAAPPPLLRSLPSLWSFPYCLIRPFFSPFWQGTHGRSVSLQSQIRPLQCNSSTKVDGGGKWTPICPDALNCSSFLKIRCCSPFKKPQKALKWGQGNCGLN